MTTMYHDGWLTIQPHRTPYIWGGNAHDPSHSVGGMYVRVFIVRQVTQRKEENRVHNQDYCCICHARCFLKLYNQDQLQHCVAVVQQ